MAVVSGWRKEVFEVGPIFAMRTTWALGAAVALLLTLCLAGQVSRFAFGHDNVFGFVPLFDPDAEGNVPALFSAGLLLTTSAMLARLVALDRGRRRVYWALLAIGFLLMAGDEWFALHERLIPLLRRRSLPGIFHFAWLLVGLPLVAACAAIFARFWWTLPATTRAGTALAAVTFLSGAIGAEMVGGVAAKTFGEANFGYASLVIVEEGLEMSGLVVMIGTLVHYLRASIGGRHREPVVAALGLPSGK